MPTGNAYISSELHEILIFTLKLSISLLCSAVIGLEREKKGRPAGLRTHIVVCMASTLVMSVGIALKDDYLTVSSSLDPSRLAAQIISGIGFLGAGTIFKSRDSVYGLTTAASLWSVACVGIAVGAGYYIEAVFTMLAILVVLKVVNYFERKIRDKQINCRVVLEISKRDADFKELMQILDSHNLLVDELQIIGDRKADSELGEVFDWNIVALHLRSYLSMHRTSQRNPEDILSKFSFIKIKSFQQL